MKPLATPFLDPETVPDLQGLFDLARTTGLDFRPTLLRVVTDLFVERRIYSVDAARRYILLTMELLDTANLETKKIVAGKLAGDRLAPHQIVLRLARDNIAVAEPVLRQSPLLTTSELDEIARTCGPDHAAIVADIKAARVDAAGALARSFAPAATEQGPALSASVAAAPSDAKPRARRERQAPPQWRELSELFFLAGSEERRLILMNLDVMPPAAPLAAEAPRIMQRMETAALRGQADAFVRALEDAFRISARQARRIASDASGEPLVVVARALGMSLPTLERILLTLNPAIGHSVTRVYALADLYRDISPEAARLMVDIWYRADPRPQRGARHIPVLAPDAGTGFDTRTAGAARPATTARPAAAPLRRLVTEPEAAIRLR